MYFTSQNHALLLCRFPQQTFVQMAGGIMKQLISILFTAFPKENGRDPGAITDAVISLRLPVYTREGHGNVRLPGLAIL